MLRGEDLKLFFENESNCKCRKTKDRICFKKIGFRNFLERQLQLKGLEGNELDLCIKTQLMVFKLNDEDDDEEKDIYNYQYNLMVAGWPSLVINGCWALRQNATPRAAPTRLPTMAWLELLGIP